MENEENVIKETKSTKVPNLLTAICWLNFIGLGYMLFITLYFAANIEPKTLIYYSILFSIVGIISNIGLLSMKKWALYAYTIICIGNWSVSSSIGEVNYISVIFSAITLIVVWSYENKMEGSKYFNEKINGLFRTLFKTIGQKQNTVDNNKIDLNVPLDNTIISYNESNQREIEKSIYGNKIKERNQIKEKSYINRHKLVIPVLCVWSFIHTLMVLRLFAKNYLPAYRIDGGGWIFTTERFYPFTVNFRGHKGYFDIRFYDYTEYFVYVGGVWMIYFLYKYLKGNK